MLNHSLRLSRSSSTTIRRMMSSQEPDVLFETVNQAGIITLNRPKALNSLNNSMVNKLLPQLQEWEKERSLVIIKGAGDKALCAGGDVKSLILNKYLAPPFFATEYNVNHIIGTYKIPYIAIINGIAMGGGLGVSVHGRYRIATEKTMIAMPETKIGLFPDVGGSYFLPRLEVNLGLYLGLTGYRLKGQDVMKSGIATHYIPSNRLFELEKLLTRCTNDSEIQNLLTKFSETSATFTLADNIKNINYCFAAGSIEEIYERLEKVQNDWSKKTLETLSQMCPGSMKITLRALQRGAQLELGQCLQMEYRLALHSIQNHDFPEGVRALLIDKDNNPKWDPKTLSDVSEEYVESFFKKLPEKEELKLVRNSAKL